MSKYIPGNQKHLTIEDRIYIQNELDKGTSFKDIARFLCKDPTTISKEVKARRASDWFHKGTFLNAKNFCTNVSAVRKRMPAIRSFFAALNVLPVPPVTRPVRIFKKNAAANLIGLPTSAMDAVKRSIIVRLPTNIPTMPGSLIGNTGSVSRIPGPESL